MVGIPHPLIYCHVLYYFLTLVLPSSGSPRYPPHVNDQCLFVCASLDRSQLCSSVLCLSLVSFVVDFYFCFVFLFVCRILFSMPCQVMFSSFCLELFFFSEGFGSHLCLQSLTFFIRLRYKPALEKCSGKEAFAVTSAAKLADEQRLYAL